MKANYDDYIKMITKAQNICDIAIRKILKGRKRFRARNFRFRIVYKANHLGSSQIEDGLCYFYCDPTNHLIPTKYALASLVWVAMQSKKRRNRPHPSVTAFDKAKKAIGSKIFSGKIDSHHLSNEALFRFLIGYLYPRRMREYLFIYWYIKGAANEEEQFDEIKYIESMLPQLKSIIDMEMLTYWGEILEQQCDKNWRDKYPELVVLGDEERFRENVIRNAEYYTQLASTGYSIEAFAQMLCDFDNSQCKVMSNL